MTIPFKPKPGNVLMCDFTGYVAPEMIKIRPVVIVSPAHLPRPGLVSVVPLSTTVPDPIQPYHYRLTGNPIPGSAETQIWAKCDMLATIRVERLDRIRVGRGNYQTAYVSMDQVRAIRCCIVLSLGFDPAAVSALK